MSTKRAPIGQLPMFDGVGQAFMFSETPKAPATSLSQIDADQLQADKRREIKPLPGQIALEPVQELEAVRVVETVDGWGNVMGTREVPEPFDVWINNRGFRIP